MPAALTRRFPMSARLSTRARRSGVSPAPQVKMQKIIAALALSGAAAYVAPVAPKATSSLAASKDEVVALAEANPDFLGKAIGFWDPLGARAARDGRSLGCRGRIEAAGTPRTAPGAAGRSRRRRG